MGCQNTDTLPGSVADRSADDVVIVTTASVDASGLQMEAGRTGTPIDGVVVTIPPDAVTEEDTIALGYTRKPVEVVEGQWCGVTIVISMGHTTSFKEYVTVKVPYDASEEGASLVIPYQVDEAGGLHVMDIANIDRETQSLLVTTWRPCAFTWVYP